MIDAKYTLMISYRPIFCAITAFGTTVIATYPDSFHAHLHLKIINAEHSHPSPSVRPAIHTLSKNSAMLQIQPTIVARSTPCPAGLGFLEDLVGEGGGRRHQILKNEHPL
jgi:hypothetical protein